MGLGDVSNQVTPKEALISLLRIFGAGVISTARRLFEGRVLVPSDLRWPSP